MIGSIGSIVLLVIIIGCVFYWFVLKKQIDEEESSRIEPHIDSSFSEFSQQDLPKDSEDDYEAEFEPELALEPEPKKEKVAMKAEKMVEKPIEMTSENRDLFEEAAEEMDREIIEEPKKGFLARLKETFVGDKDNANESSDEGLGRPAPIKTVALILRAPEDQPYLGREVLEVGEELKLMIGGEGFLQEIVTTYLGDEPMYSIAHMIHPGSFNDTEILNTEIPGLLFFAQIPGPDPQMNTVQNLLKAAAFFGQELGGTLLDENQRPVTSEYIQDLMADVSELEQKAWSKYRSKH